MCQKCKALFILHSNTAAFTDILIIFYHSSKQHTAPQVHFTAVLKCSTQCRNRKYEHCISLQCRCSGIWSFSHKHVVGLWELCYRLYLSILFLQTAARTKVKGTLFWSPWRAIKLDGMLTPLNVPSVRYHDLLGI